VHCTNLETTFYLSCALVSHLAQRASSKDGAILLLWLNLTGGELKPHAVLSREFRFFNLNRSQADHLCNWQYMQDYEACLSATSTKIAPWYVVPADDKENARLIISRIILDTFKALELRYPKTDAKRRQELLSIRDLLVKEGPAGD
jgi:hypothetical protein